MNSKAIVAVILLFQIMNVECNKAQEPVEKPQKVYSIIKQLNPDDWYFSQAKLWYAEIQKDDKNAVAWQNFYEANRMARMVDKAQYKELLEKELYIKKLDKIIDELEKTLPDSYEFNYLKFRNGGMKDKLFPYLEKAYEINPERVDTYDEFIVHYETQSNKKKFKEFCRKFYENNLISPNITSFNYNVLMSLDENAIIFTNGDNDTYPIWIMQQAQGIRTDVSVVNMSLILIEKYRKQYFKELGLGNFEFSDEEYFNKKENNPTFQGFVKTIRDYVLENSKRPVYFALTTSDANYDDIKDDLYITGLALKYSKTKFDNIAVLRYNFEKKFALDYLKVNFAYDISKEVVNQINTSYMLPMLKLYNHYLTCGDNDKATEIKKLGSAIAQKGGYDWEEAAKHYFE